ncbi:MAG: hypothetical protein KGZ79_04110 [Dethiobacter sp.]|nr:hypothetical protein [Dethiobacter sp.]
MRQAVSRSAKKKLRSRFLFLIILFLAVMQLTFLAVFFARSDKRKIELPAEEVVAIRVHQAGDYRDFSLTIEESGPGYSLKYSGLVKDGMMYGTLESFDLQVFSYYDMYYVRGGDVFNEWQTVEKAELQALAAFVRNPLPLLSRLLAEEYFSVESGPDRLIEGVPCQAFLLDVSPSASLLGSLFSVLQEDDVLLEQMRVYIWFGTEDNFLYKMALLFDIVTTKEKVQVTRVYSMNRQQAYLPDDLPLGNKTLEI